MSFCFFVVVVVVVVVIVGEVVFDYREDLHFRGKHAF